MSLKCLFGLVACLDFQGNMIPAETAVEIMDACFTLQRMPIGEYRDVNARGSIRASNLWDDGLKYTYPKNVTPTQRKATVVRACSAFESAFNNKQKWDNLDKWPF